MVFLTSCSFAEVRTWMDNTLETCRKEGFVNTILGRRRLLTNISSELQAERAQAERQAVNTCIQVGVLAIFVISSYKN